MGYRNNLPADTSLQVFNRDQLIFSSSGKWLHPLFDFEEFLKNYSGDRSDLSSHDSAIGKAAAVLSIRAGIKKINAEILSQIALDYINEYNADCSTDEKIEVTWTSLVPELMCATENQLEPMHDPDEMYTALRRRAKLVQGVEVSVTNLWAPFGNIQDLSFSLQSGGHLMVTGENGAGKTTLLRMLAGINRPVSGTILIDGKNPKELPQYTIGYIPQFTQSDSFSLNVEEVVSLGIHDEKKSGRTKKQIVEESLARTSCLELKKRSFNSLSGGEKQKVLLARCLAQNAKLLLLDEPTASLDGENKKMVTDIIHSLTISEIPTIIIVTHDRELAALRGWETLELSQQKNDMTDNSQAVQE